MTPLRRRRLLSAGLAIVVVVAAPAAVRLVGAHAPAPAPAQAHEAGEGTDPFAELECPAGEPLVQLHNIYAAPRPGARTTVPTAEEAVAREIAHSLPGLRGDAIQRADIARDAVKFRYAPGGSPLAIFDANRHGPDWVVESVVTCESLLQVAGPEAAVRQQGVRP